MEARIAHLEGRFDGMDKRLDRIDVRLAGIEDKIPTEWTIAKVVALVIGAFMAVAAWGPQVIDLLSRTTP